MRRLSESPVSWPVVAFGGDGSLVCVETFSTLLRPSARALRSGYFNGLMLMDAEGTVCRVDEVILDQQNVFLSELRRILNLRVPVELLLGESWKVTLQEAKAKIILKVRDDRSFWESGGDLLDLEEQIAAAPSFGALYALLR